MYKSLLLVLALPASTFAQTVRSPEAAAQMARVDSMMPAWEVAWERTRTADSIRIAHDMRSEEQDFDTLRMGPIQVISLHSVSARVFPEFRRAINDRANLLAGVRVKEPFTIFVEKGTQIRRFQKMGRGRPATSVSLPTGIRRAWQHRAVDNTIDNIITTFLPDSVRAWLGEESISPGRDLAYVHRELAVTDVALAEHCRAGDVSACLRALEITARLDSLRGRTPEEVRVFVAREYRSREFDPYLTDRCVKGHDEVACLERLRYRGGPPLPLSRDARASFLLTALSLGGGGAIARMQAGPASAGEAIAAAAGTDLQSLTKTWLANVERAGRATRAGMATGALASVIWAAVALTLALRSTRRRLG